jgi:Tol biopolymer transport system component
VSNRDGSNDVYLMDRDGANQGRLTDAVALNLEGLEPAFSRDGKRIAFTSYRTGVPEICVMDSDGTNETCLTENRTGESDPVLSPDGENLAFVSDRDGNSEVYVLNSDGTDPVRLTDSPEVSERWPSFSPDGTKIAFTGITGPGDSPDADVYVMDSDGANRTRLTDDPAWDSYPSFSPVGTKIAFMTNRDRNMEIYAMDTDGANQVNLTNNPAQDVGPVFSAAPRTATVAAPHATTPDSSKPIRLMDNLCYYPSGGELKIFLSPNGSKVTFVGCSTGGLDIFVANSDGTRVVNLTKSPEVTEGDSGVALSPDGEKVAFHRYAHGNNLFTAADIFVANIDGTGLTNLTGDPEADESWPAFSPNGDKIAFVHSTAPNESPNSDVYVMDLDGTGLTNLTPTPDDDEQAPVFLPDGDKIRFMRWIGPNESRSAEVYVIDPDGKNQTRLPESIPAGATFSPDGEKVAFERSTTEAPIEHPPSATVYPIDIYVANVDGTGLTRLTDHPGYDGQPAFIPGTDRVAFVSGRDGDDDIYAMGLDGSGLINLTDTDSASENSPTFSADGTKMAYASVWRDDSGNLVNEIYVTKIDGTD